LKNILQACSQQYWQQSFDGDSLASQSRFDAYADAY